MPLTEAQRKRILFKASLYDRDEGYLREEEVDNAAADLGIDVDNYSEGFNGLVAINCIDIIMGRGIPEDRASRLEKRRLQLARANRGAAVAPTPSIPSTGGLDQAAVQALINNAGHLDRSEYDNNIPDNSDLNSVTRFNRRRWAPADLKLWMENNVSRINNLTALINNLVPSWARNNTPPRAVPDDATAVGQVLRAVSLRQGNNPGLYGWGNPPAGLPAGAQNGRFVGQQNGVIGWYTPPTSSNGGNTNLPVWVTDGNEVIPTAKLGALTGNMTRLLSNQIPNSVTATQSSRLATTTSITIGENTLDRIVNVDVDVTLSFSGFQPHIEVQILFDSTVHQSKLIDPDEDGSFVFELPAGRDNFNVAIVGTGGSNFSAQLDVTGVTFKYGSWAEMDTHIEALAKKEIALADLPENHIHISKQGSLLHFDPEEQIDFQAPDWSILSSNAAAYGGRRTAVIHPGMTIVDSNGVKLSPITSGMTSDSIAATGFPVQTLRQGNGVRLTPLSGGNICRISGVYFVEYGTEALANAAGNVTDRWKWVAE